MKRRYLAACGLLMALASYVLAGVVLDAGESSEKPTPVTIRQVRSAAFKRMLAMETTTTTSTTTTTTTAPPTTTTTQRANRAARPVAPNPDRAAVLDCIWRHEGSPAYDNGIGTNKKYRGRYQFGQDSWDNVAAKPWGRPDLVGVDVATASPADQDDMAWRYYQHSGYGPWPPSQGKCP